MAGCSPRVKNERSLYTATPLTQHPATPATTQFVRVHSLTTAARRDPADAAPTAPAAPAPSHAATGHVCVCALTYKRSATRAGARSARSARSPRDPRDPRSPRAQSRAAAGQVVRAYSLTNAARHDPAHAAPTAPAAPTRSRAPIGHVCVCALTYKRCATRGDARSARGARGAGGAGARSRAAAGRVCVCALTYTNAAGRDAARPWLVSAPRTRVRSAPAAVSALVGCEGAPRVRQQRFLSTIMRFRRRQIGHRHDRGEKVHLWVHELSKITAMSDLSSAVFHDRGEKNAGLRRESAS